MEELYSTAIPSCSKESRVANLLLGERIYVVEKELDELLVLFVVIQNGSLTNSSGLISFHLEQVIRVLKFC